MNIEISGKVIGIIENITRTPLLRKDDLLSKNILDSLVVMQLVTDLEQEFQIIIPAVNFTHHTFNSIEAIVDLICDLIE